MDYTEEDYLAELLAGKLLKMPYFEGQELVLRPQTYEQRRAFLERSNCLKADIRRALNLR